MKMSEVKLKKQQPQQKGCYAQFGTATSLSFVCDKLFIGCAVTERHPLRADKEKARCLG